MTVGELKEKLQDMPYELDVTVVIDGYIYSAIDAYVSGKSLWNEFRIDCGDAREEEE